MFKLQNHPHRRYNPLMLEWVLVSPHRTQRPWQGQTERRATAAQPSYDPDCYLCPGNARAGGVRNPVYTSTFVFQNDFSALLPDTPEESYDSGGLLIARTEPGVCRVVCFSPRHDLTLSRMEVSDIRRVVDVWAEEYTGLGKLPFVQSVLVFENRGEMMGASNPHPHCQIWATCSLPDAVAKEQSAQEKHARERGRCLLCQYVELERKSGERIVCENEWFTALVPFWAVWPFETIVIANQHATGLDELGGTQRDGLADILRRLTTRFDNLFETPFPYTMGFHQRPTDGDPHPEWHLHAHFFPPLLRSATIRKFMVGFEMLGMPQRDITPETAADRLRSLSERHYLDE